MCDVADKYCDGYLRFTTRNNVEFLVSDKAKLQPLITDLKSRGNWFPIGGTGNSIHQHRPYPGLGSLPHPRHRRLGCGEVRDGRPVRVFRIPQAAGPGAVSLWLAA